MNKVIELKDKMLIPIKKYYVALLLFAFATIEMLLIIRQDYYGINFDNHIKLMFTLIYGSIVALVVRDIVDRIYNKIKQYNLFYLLIPVLMAIVYYVILSDFDSVFSIFKYFTLCVLTSITFLIVPFLGKEEDSEHYSYKVIISLILTGICYSLLTLGIILIIFSISTLFEIAINEYIYIEIPIFILGFIMPTVFLSIIPSIELKRKEYPLFINKILMYIVFPILSIYTVVLYAYFIKILFTLKWPSNMLGNLVIYYSLISVIVLYFANNMKNDKWGNYFINIYPYTLILPMMMMLISFIIRINYYGLTEVRYYALVCFIFVMASIFIIKLTNKVKYIPLTLSILLLISTFGPLSAMNVSKISQEKRLEQILTNNNMLENNSIVKNANIDEKDKKEIYNILIFFEKRNILNDIDVLPKDFALSDMEKVFGFTYDEL